MTERPVPIGRIRTSEIASLAASYRIQPWPVVMRVPRVVGGGGFADHTRRATSWTVVLMVDGQWREVESTRGLRREWSGLDGVERWLREQGFDVFMVRSDDA